MISIKVDPHTHTLASGHAFSTISENAIFAKEKGLEAIAMTDHFGFMYHRNKEASLMGVGPTMNMPALPKVIHDVRILAGTEIDIIDFDGNLAGHDLKGWIPDKSFADTLLDSREVAIASVHGFPGHTEGTIMQNTKMLCTVAANPKIDIIGHPTRNGLSFEIDEVLKVAKQSGCMMEINEHSFDFDEETIKQCRNLAIRCAELGVSVVVGSDAHSAFYIGDFTRALAMLEEINFPEELVANVSLDRLLNRVARA